MGTLVNYSDEQIMEMLNEAPFFKHFSLYEKKRVAGFEGGFVSFSPGAKIITEGKKDTSFYIILSGKASTSHKGAHLNTMGPGDLFGEMAFFTNTERSSTVTATSNVLLFCFNQDSLNRLGCDIREKIKDQCIHALQSEIHQSSLEITGGVFREGILKMADRINRLTERLRMRM